MFDVLDIAGETLLVLPEDGPPLRDAGDVLGDVMAHRATWAAVPVDRLDPDFFVLRSGVAGELTQKFATYRVGLAIVGAVPGHGEAFDAWVRESERGRSLWFVPDLATLRARLGG